MHLICFSGETGFVRGGTSIAIIGVALAVADGIFFTLILIFSQRLDKAGVGAFAVLGLRLPLYIIAAGSLAALGVDTKEPLSALEITSFVAIGLLLTLPPLYFLQKAVSLLSTLTISSLTILGPLIIFAMQIIEGRVNYSWTTLVGISIYSLASIFSAVGAERATIQTPTKS